MTTKHPTGCDCRRCEGRRAANRLRMRRRRLALRGLDVPAAEAAAGAATGAVLAAVNCELAQLDADDLRPADAAVTRALAKILDNPKLSTTHPSAARQLRAAVDAIRADRPVRRGRLLAVAAMSARD
jgi:hypothetical protein